MDAVFLLWHVHTLQGNDEELFIGAYSSENDARAAIDRLRDKPGFVNYPDGFQIHPYKLNLDHWTEGFVTEG